MKITSTDAFEAQEELRKLSMIHDDEDAKKFLGETMSGLPVTYDIVQKLRAYDEFIIAQQKEARR